MTLPRLFLTTGSIFALLQPVTGAVIFTDNFEAGLGAWTPTAGTPSPLVISTAQNIQPAGGTSSALMDTSADRMHHNVIADNGGSEVSGHAIFTYWLYDDGGSASRAFNEVRGYSGTGIPNGGTTANGALTQLLAIGEYNSNTMPGETWTNTRYQGRLTFGATVGWFDLEGPGVPSRSVGWHRFDIERLADGTTVNFYVDSILGRSFTGATAADWDTIILGPGLGTTAGNAWFDGVSLQVIPEPAASGMALLAGLGLLVRRRR